MTTAAAVESLRKLARDTDNALAAVGVQIARQERDRAGHIRALRDLLGLGKHTPADEVLTEAHRRGDCDLVALRCRKIGEIEDALTDLVAERSDLDAIFESNGRWSRFFMVAGGHIHASTACSTCNNGAEPTQFGWLIALSAMTEADAVAAHGALLCTVCFPSAPVEWTNFYEVAAAAKKAAQCPGSGTRDYPRDTARMGFAAGNYGTCTHCGEDITLTGTNKLRRHTP